MATPEQALETQLSNIEAKTGLAREALYQAALGQGFAKHGEMVAWLKSEHGLGHGDANAVAHMARKSADAAPGSEDPLDDIYAGGKAHLRPIHAALMAEIDRFGPFETAPKKGYVSLRRKKQFAMLGPKTKDRFELGLNLKEAASHPRMKALPPGGMCQYVVALSDPAEIDAEIIALARRAYDAAG